LAEHNNELKAHLEAPQGNGKKFFHPQHQNDLIDINGYCIIQQDIFEEIRKAGFHANMADEASSFNKAIMSLCFRFVDTNLNIREEFLNFIDPHQTDGKTLVDDISRWYESKDFDINMWRGKAYDGASNMSSGNVGLGARITAVNPKRSVLSLYVSWPGFSHWRGMQAVDNHFNLK